MFKTKIFMLCMLLSCMAIVCDAQFGKLKNPFNKKGDKTSDSTKNDGDKAKEENTSKEKKGGPNLFTKFVTKVAKMTGGAMQTSSTNDLSTVLPMVFYQTNLPPGNLGTAEQSFYEGWKTGGNMLGVMFTKKDDYGFTKLDGNVTIDGKPAEFITMGLYNAFSASNTTSRKVEVTSSKGQKSSFTINPPKHAVKIISINGEKGETINADLTKDVTLELENPAGSENTMVAVRLLAKSIGLSYWSEVGFFPSANKIVIPAAYFRNINNNNANGLTNFKKSFFAVVRTSTDKATDVSGEYPVVEYSNSYLDGRYMNISPDLNISSGIKVKASDKFDDGSVQYELNKTNAFSSRPLSKVKKIGVASFSLRGILYDYKSDTKYNIGDESYTRTTQTLIFPQLPTQMWDVVLENLYQDFTKVLQEELNARILAADAIKNTDAYKRMNEFSKDEANTSVTISRGYKGLKVISAFVPLADQWGPNSNMQKLINETGADAILKFTLDLQIAYDGKQPVMVPKVAMDLIGANNGETYPTKFFTASIIGKGVRTKENITPAELDKIVRRSDLVTQFRKGLQELKTKEKENGDYDIIWK